MMKLLTITVPSYNSEAYLDRCMATLLPGGDEVEILIVAAVSPDLTEAIADEYERKYPGKFQMFYRTENMNGKHPNNAGDLKRRCVGKYIIALEGDDYWLDENKIERQIEFLENNPDYVAVAHNCLVVDKDSKPIDKGYPECKDNEYTIKHFVSEIMPGQLTTMMCRNYIKDDSMDISFFNKGLRPGDRLVYFAMTLNGKIYCMQEKMSAYRFVYRGGTSYTANYKYDFKKAEEWNLSLIEYSKKNKLIDGIKYGELLYLRNLIKGVSTKQCSLKQSRGYLKKISHKGRAFRLYVIHWIRHHILHITLWV